MKVLSYNIRSGGVGRERALSSVIRAARADLVVLQEATHAGVVERLARDAGYPWWTARAGHSLAAMAARPPASVDWRWLPSARHAHLEIAPGGGALPIVGVHLRAIHSNWTEKRRTQDVAALLRRVEAMPRPLLVGDFNTLAPAEPLDMLRLPWRLRPFVWLSGGSITWRVVDQITAAGYVDGYRLQHRESADGFTFPAWDPHLRLDYAFLPRPAADRLAACEVLGDLPGVRVASDHLPLLVTLAD